MGRQAEPSVFGETYQARQHSIGFCLPHQHSVLNNATNFASCNFQAGLGLSLPSSTSFRLRKLPKLGSGLGEWAMLGSLGVRELVVRG